MSELLSLPIDVLLIIIEQVLPPDIENFSQTCRSIHCLSKNARSTHVANKKNYSKLTLRTRAKSRDVPTQHPLAVIRDILQNDRVAFYPVEVVIIDWDAYQNDINFWVWETPEETEDDISRTLREFDDEIFALISDCSHLDSSEVEEWHALVQNRFDGASVVLLLTMLPNIEKLTIRQYSCDNSALRVIVEKLSRLVHNRSPELQQPTLLSKVLNVTLEGSRGAQMNLTVNGRDIGLFGLFAALPSIRCIHVRRCTGWIDQWQRILPMYDTSHRPAHEGPGDSIVPCSSSLREVHFTRSTIHLDLLRRFVCSVKTLQRFRYSNEQNPSYQNEASRGKLDPRGIIALLKTHAKSSLVQLELTGFYRKNDASLLDGFLESLRAFEVLERISVDAATFRGYSGSFRECQLPTGTLSTSLKELKLATKNLYGDSSVLVELVELLSDPQKKLLPNLRQIVLHPRIRFSEDLLSECRKAGISLKIATRDT